jgi:hypothetical protein
MGDKKKTVTVSTPAEALRFLWWTKVNDLLRQANENPENLILRDCFFFAAEGGTGWPKWRSEVLNIVDEEGLNSFFFDGVFDKLRSMVRAGDIHVRICPHCSQWFIADHGAQRWCTNRKCQNAQVAARQRKARSREQAEQRSARVTIKRTRQ